jgi:hypothetical protein
MSRRLAPLDDVHVHRHGNSAVIAFEGEPRSAVWLELGPAARTLTDQEILDRHHQRVLELVEQSATMPQVCWDDASGTWRPYGRVVRCVVEGGPTLHEPLIMIDELELTLAELGRMLVGHGAHVCMLFLDE